MKVTEHHLRTTQKQKTQDHPSSLKRLTSVEPQDIFLQTQQDQIITQEPISPAATSQDFNNDLSSPFAKDFSSAYKKKTQRQQTSNLENYMLSPPNEQSGQYVPKKSRMSSLAKLPMSSMTSFSNPEYVKDFQTFNDNLPEELFFRNEKRQELPSNLMRLIKLKLAKKEVSQRYKAILGERRRGLESEGNKIKVRKLNGKIHDLSVENNMKKSEIEKANIELKNMRDEVVLASNFFLCY